MPCIYNANAENLVSLTAELALRVLLQNKISLIEFVEYVVDQRNILLQNVSGISTPLWKYELLTDKSIERFMSRNVKKKQFPENNLTLTAFSALNSLKTINKEKNDIISDLYSLDRSDGKNTNYTLESVETTYSSSDSYNPELSFNGTKFNCNLNFLEESPNKAFSKKNFVSTQSLRDTNAQDMKVTDDLIKNCDQISVKNQMNFNGRSNFNIKTLLAPPPDYKPHPQQKSLFTDNILVQILCTPIIKLNQSAQTVPFSLPSKETEEVKPASEENSVKKKKKRVINAARKKQGSRRTTECENVFICPECNKRGQSIFDPKLGQRDGNVYEYFYCRNNQCLKGRSASRYIGWRVREK